MKKKALALIGVLVLAISLCACTNQDKEEDNKPIIIAEDPTSEVNESASDIDTTNFHATVVALNGSMVTVTPVYGSYELQSSDKFDIINNPDLNLQVGDKVNILYDGNILETYPAQLSKIYEITVEDRAAIKEMLTLEDLREIIKGIHVYNHPDLNWSDFEKYEYTDIGSGMYIRRYEIDDYYELLIGGKSLDEEPEYIRLRTTNDESNYIDIREEEAEYFLTQEKINHIDRTQTPYIMRTYRETPKDGNIVVFMNHYMLSDGTFKTDNRTYKYMTQIVGIEEGKTSAEATAFVYLINNNFDYDKAWEAAISGHPEIYYNEEDAVLVFKQPIYY